MTKYLQPTPFTVNDPVATPAYREGWERCFGKKYCDVCKKDAVELSEEINLCQECSDKLEKEFYNYELALAVGREITTPFYNKILKIVSKNERL